MQMIRCPHCAKELFRDAQFCRRCGCAVQRYAAPLYPPVIPPPMPPPTARAVPLRRIGTFTAPKRPPAAQKSGGGGGLIALLAIVSVASFLGRHATHKAATAPPTSPSYTFPRIQSYPVQVDPPRSFPTPMRSNAPLSSRPRDSADRYDIRWRTSTPAGPAQVGSYKP